MIPIAIGMNPATAKGTQKPSLYEYSPAAIKSARTNIRLITDRFLGMKNLIVAAHTKRHANEHATGHQMAFPAIMNSRQSDTRV